MAGNSNIKWTTVEHSLTKHKGTGKHIILVSYEDRGKEMKNVRGVIPLYDLNDQNLDGSVSFTEKWWWSPFGIYKLINTANETSCVTDAAKQLNDWELYNSAIAGFLQTTHDVCTKAITQLTVEKVLSPGVKLTLAQTGLAELRKGSAVALFIIQKGFEIAVIESICAVRKRTDLL